MLRIVGYFGQQLNHSKTVNNIILSNNDKMLKDEKKAAKTLNDYFTNLTRKLKLKPTTLTDTTHLKTGITFPRSSVPAPGPINFSTAPGPNYFFAGPMYQNYFFTVPKGQNYYFRALVVENVFCFLYFKVSNFSIEVR